MAEVSVERLAEWVARLVRIPSVSPGHAGPRAGVTGEAAIQAAVSGWLAGFGGTVEQQEALPGRDNVLAVFPGRSDRLVALDVHVDTVGVEQMLGDPFDGRIEDGRVYGRGAVDTKASLGVALAVLEGMHAAGERPGPTVLVVATAEEEVGLSGAFAFARLVRERGLDIHELLVAEPTLCQPVFGHKGAVRQRFTVEGVAAHTAQPHLGRNAISAAARIVAALDAEHARLQEPGAVPAASGHLGAPTLTPALIEGGRALNVVPDRCTVSHDRRTIDTEDPAAIAAGIEAIVRAASPLPVEAEAPAGRAGVPRAARRAVRDAARRALRDRARDRHLRHERVRVRRRPRARLRRPRPRLDRPGAWRRRVGRARGARAPRRDLPGVVGGRLSRLPPPHRVASAGITCSPYRSSVSSWRPVIR